MKLNASSTAIYKQTIIFFLFFTWNSYAQFTLSGELRPRSEYRHGYKTLAFKNQDAAIFIEQRTRLNFGYLANRYKLKLVVQDVRTWGSQPQLNTTDGLTSIHEAWGELYFNPKFSFKFGRQEIFYDDHRIFGSVNWAQQARSHDAGIFKYKDSTFIAHAGFAYNQDGPSLSGSIAKNGTYKSFQYLWLHKGFGKLNGSFLFLNNGKQVISVNDNGTEDGYDNYSQTLGLRLEYKAGSLAYHLGGYYQTGKEGDSLNTKISAYNIRADVLYKLSDTFNLAAGIELLSGNSETKPNGKNNAFNPLYGTNHKFNGYMDYFYVGNHTGSVGLNDIFIQAYYKKNKFFIGGDIHFFMANNDVLDVTIFNNSGRISNAQNYLGTEIDLNGGYILTKGVAIKAGYSQLFASNSMEYIKGGDKSTINNWGWLMITLKPTFIGNQ